MLIPPNTRASSHSTLYTIELFNPRGRCMKYNSAGIKSIYIHTGLECRKVSLVGANEIVIYTVHTYIHTHILTHYTYTYTLHTYTYIYTYIHIHAYNTHTVAIE